MRPFCLLRRATLEQAIACVAEDALVAGTPRTIRLRKKVLNPSFRKRRVKDELGAGGGAGAVGVRPCLPLPSRAMLDQPGSSGTLA